MNWKALKNGKCPKCGEILKQGTSAYLVCSCGFKISEAKVWNIIKEKSPPPDNFADLQNLGHEKLAEDFSDSRHLDY